MKKSILFKIIPMLFGVIMYVLPNGVFAQTNIAPLATITAAGSSAPGCQTGPCSTLNDLNFGTCGPLGQQMWINTSTPPSTVPGVNFIEWNFPTVRTFDSLIIHHAQTTGRFLGGATVQFWDGSAWVTHSTFSNLPQTNCVNRVGIGVLTAQRFRITAMIPGPTGQQSNLNFREIEILEASTAPNDAGVASIDSPLVVCSPSANVFATIRNFGTNIIDSVTVNWSYNGTAQTPFQYIGTLDTSNGLGTPTAQINLGTITVPAGLNEILVYTTNPNGVADTTNANDTARIFVGQGLSGTYTINSASPTAGTNFNSFTDFETAIATLGQCGPLVINVAAGTYNESVVFSNIRGNSATNSVTINGIDSVTTIINGTDFSTIALEGVTNFTIRNMGIHNNSTTASISMLLGSGARNNVIENCEIKASTSSTDFDLTALATSASTQTRSTGAVGTDNNLIANNRIVGGYYGVYFYGSTSDYLENNDLINNDIDSANVYGIWSYYGNNSDIIGNDVETVSRGATNADGIYLGYHGNHILEANNVIAPDWGIYWFNNVATIPAATIKSRIVNNMVLSETDFAIRLGSVDSLDIWHNTFVTRTTGAAAIEIERFTFGFQVDVDDYDVRNNIFFAEGSDAFLMDNIIDTIFTKFDNNIFNTVTGTDLVDIDGTTYVDLLAYQTAQPLLNINSLEGDPLFLSPTDLHLFGGLANEAADTSINVLTDIDGDVRPSPGASVTDIGADEYIPPTCLPLIGGSAIAFAGDSALLRWNGTASMDYQFEIVLAGAAQGTGTSNFTVFDSVRVGGLIGGTSYEFYVRQICTRGDTSFWVGPFAFTTPCSTPSPVILPFFEDFETFSGTLIGDGVISCDTIRNWNFETSNQTEGRVRWGADAESAFPNSTGHATLDKTPAGGFEQNRMILTLNMTSYLNRGLELYFDYMDHGDENQPGDSIWIRGSNFDPWIPVFFLDPQNQTNLDPVSVGPIDIDQALANNSQLLTSTFQVAFGQEDNFPTGSDGISFDNIEVRALAPRDGGITELITPGSPLCPGTIQPVVAMENLGTDTINSFTIVWDINGVLDSITFNQTVLPDGIFNATLGNVTFANGVSYDVKIYTTNVNGLGVDSIPGNDTLRFDGLRTGLNGVYTIDSSAVQSATNFQSFTEVANILNNFGNCGPVTINVVTGSGPYNEQIEFSGVNATAANPIVINGNGDTLQFAVTNANQRAVLTFANSDYITVDSLNIIALSSGTYGWGVHITGDPIFNTPSSHINILNSTIEVPATSGSSAIQNGIVSSGSRTSATIGVDNNNLRIENNLITGGWAGITISGNFVNRNPAFVIRNNTIQDFDDYGVRITYADSSDISLNDIERGVTRTSGTFMYGIYLLSCENTIVDRNQIHNSHGSLLSKTGTAYPFYFTGDATPGNETYVTNNIVYDINSNGTVYGVYDLGYDGMRFINNTISLDDTSSTGGEVRGIFVRSPLTSGEYLNNIVSINRTGGGIKHGLYYDSPFGTPPFGPAVSDLNDVFVSSTGGTNWYGNRDGVDYTDLTAFQAATTYEANGVEVDPNFNTPDSLFPAAGLLNSIASPSPFVTTDYYGVARGLAPDIGAVEFDPPPYDDMSVNALLAPVFNQDSCYGASQDVIVRLLNAGGNVLDFAVTPLTLTVDVIGGTTATLTQTINTNALNGGNPLPLGGSIDVTAGTINMTTVGQFDFDIYISMATDTVATNDTLPASVTIQVPFVDSLLGPDSICGGDSATLRVSDYIGIIQWQELSGASWIDISGANGEEVKVAPSLTTSFRAQACGSGVSDTFVLQVIAVPTPTVTNDTALVANCGDSAFVFGTASSSNPSPVFAWFENPVGGTALDSNDTYLVSAAADSIRFKGVTDTTLGNFNAIDTVWVEEQVPGPPSSTLLITEAELGPDWIEVTNVSGDSVDVTGWAVAIGDDPGNINAPNADVQILNGVWAPDSIYWWGDVTGPRDWGSNMFWNPSQEGWVLIIDDVGNVVDFIVFEFPQSSIATMSVVVNGFTVTPGANWIGNPLTGSGAYARQGVADNDDLNDFSTNPALLDTTAVNTGLVTPFPAPICTSTRVPVYLSVLCNPVGIEDADATLESVSLAPNPSNGLFTLNITSEEVVDYNMTIRDLTGQLIVNELINISGDYRRDFDLSNLAKGVYFLRLQSETDSHVEKIVIQ